MINSLGFQKVATLLFLIISLGAIYFYGVRTLGSQSVLLDRELRQTQSNFNEVTTKLTDLRTDIARFEVQKDKFSNLETLGFFDTQDRVKITQRLNEMQKESELLAAQYSISPAVKEPNAKAAEAGYKVLLTTISFDLQALIDEEIYEFIYMLNYGFAGHITINNLKIDKVKEITPLFLQAVGTNQASAVVNARLEVDLRTLVEDPQAIRPDEFGENF